jgi:hypothetical protein
MSRDGRNQIVSANVKVKKKILIQFLTFSCAPAKICIRYQQGGEKMETLRWQNSFPNTNVYTFH